MSAQDDLAYVREVAERGADAPLGGGITLLWWGFVTTAALVTHWMIMVGLMFQAGISFLILWTSAIFIGWVGNFVIIARLRGKGGTVSHANRTSAAVWTSAGAFLTVFSIAIVARQMTDPLGLFLYDVILAVATGIYGIAFATTAAVSGQRWLGVFALLSFGFAGTYVFLLGNPLLYLIAAFGTAITVGLPGGFIMMGRRG